MRVSVIVTPRSGKDAVLGWKSSGASSPTVDDARELAVCVTAPPEGGKATKAVCETIAKSIGIPKSAVTCVRGETSRHKQIEIDCAEKTFSAWLERLGN